MLPDDEQRTSCKTPKCKAQPFISAAKHLEPASAKWCVSFEAEQHVIVVQVCIAVQSLQVALLVQSRCDAVDDWRGRAHIEVCHLGVKPAHYSMINGASRAASDRPTHSRTHVGGCAAQHVRLSREDSVLLCSPAK